MNPKATELQKKLLLATQEGPVSQWVDRMGVLAAKAGLPLEHINWIGPPLAVSWDVIRVAFYEKSLVDRLRQVLDESL